MSLLNHLQKTGYMTQTWLAGVLGREHLLMDCNFNFCRGICHLGLFSGKLFESHFLFGLSVCAEPDHCNATFTQDRLLCESFWAPVPKLLLF